MNQTDRRQQFALLLSYGLAGVLAGICPGEAAAQGATPLQADPVLLGAPLATDERWDAPEARPIEPEVFEVQPLALGEETPAAPTLPEAPEQEEAEVVVVPVPAPERAGTSVPAERAGEADAPASSTLSTSAFQVTTLETLRVDPALLGPLPPSAERLAESSGSAVSPSPARSGTASPLPATEPPVEEKGPSGPAYADEKVPSHEPALALRAATEMEPLSESGAEPRPAFLSAQWMMGEINREFVAEGEAELRKAGSVIDADVMIYWPLEDEVEAQGHVRLQQADDVVTGPKMRLKLEDKVGHFEQPSYQIRHRSLLGGKRVSDREESDRRIEKLVETSVWNSGFASPQMTKFAPGETRFDDKIALSTTTESRGEAERIDFEGENQYRLLNNSFTTCSADDDSWYLKTSEMRLDYDREVGEGRDATVYFKGVPILYSPWLSFSLNDERKSGFLAPSIGTNSDSGFEYTQPYYWNIAPNMDATISPRLMSRRGLQLGSEFRYLNTALGGLYRSTLKAEYLPGDRLRNRDNRHALSLVHEQTTDKGFSGTINFNKVSDDDYYTDLSSDIASTSQTQLLQQGILNYGGAWWNASVNFMQYQTLQPDKDDTVREQYRMLPQATLTARKLDFRGMDLDFLGQYTRFTIRERKQFDDTLYPDGDRVVFYPQISLPYVTPGWYVTPKFGVNYRRYSLDGQAEGNPGSISVALPVFSLDSGMGFERPSRWFGREYTQTLEPRLYYLNIPYKDQSDIPLFDTAVSDFNFAQIFSENQFSGWDRVNNTRQLTAALTSRLIEPETGNEIMRAMIGRRFHFTRNKVMLNREDVPDEDEKWKRSDILASFSGQVLPKVYADTALQFGASDRRAQRYSLGMRYQPEPGKVLNASYRYNREEQSPINQVDVSGQWPLFGRWYGVGRMNYSFKDDGTVHSTGGQGGRIVESIAGLEYNGGCWILRTVIRRQALTSEDASTSFYVQLELSGLGRIGSNPLSLLKRNIQGYAPIGGRDSDAVFGDY
ncbi:MAG: LPS assembly protein LptD [Candidatus Accumulibacter sp.]|jgi:LPS-assembly protein|nr:LPS assembly protein LptD [Accumulibacter sp.]